jgi:RNA polymerase sigma factor (sigma-70 family)
MEGRPLEEAQLIERAKHGDVGAYEELVRRYQQLALSTAYVVAGDAAEAQDAAQEAFVKAYYALGRFREDALFRPWLMRIVANEAINRRRAARRSANLALRAAQAFEAAGGRPADDAVPSPEATALAHEERRVLLEAVNGLRLEDRMVIAYRYFFELTEAEMAEALGCARGTVKSRLSRALKRLRRVMEPGVVGAAKALAEGGGSDD